MQTADITRIDISKPIVMSGLLLGAMLPFVFSALSMKAVGKAAMSMIEEVRRQFNDLPKLKAALEIMRKYNSDLSKASDADMKIFNEADGVAEYSKCVEISTQAALREMVLPGLMAISVPVIIGFAGILFIIKPGFSKFNIIYILPLGTGLFYSLYMIFTSKLVNSDTPFKTLAFTGLVGLLSMSLLQPFVWVGPTIYEWILMLAMGTVAAVGHFLIILSFRFAKASVLAPFSYWEILTNILIGFYFFGNIPDKWTWLGIVIIIGSGIYILAQSRTPRYEK